MSAARKIKEPSKFDIEDLFYITINEICKRTTYDRTTVQGFLSLPSDHPRHLKSEKKNGGKRVVRVIDFITWWESLNT